MVCYCANVDERLGKELKLYVLALDGMDYDIAEKLKLENILQKQYGKLKVPINKKMGCPSSPEVWASFLCGRDVKIGFKGIKHDWMLKILRPMKRALPFISFGIGRKATGFITGFRKLSEKTWVDNPRVVEIGVPYYSYTNEVYQFIKEFSEDRDLESYRKKLYMDYLQKTHKLFGKTISILKEKKEIDVVFSYIHYPDAFNHAWFTKQQELKKLYAEINEFVGKLKTVIGKHHLLIISDHGFDFSKNTHSNFGFISSNCEMEFPESIINLGVWVKSLIEESK